MQALRKSFFIRLINNLFDREEMYEAQRDDLGIDLTAKGFMAASCEIMAPAQNARRDQISFSASVIRLVRETLARYAHCHVVPLDMWHFAVVFCLAGPAEDAGGTGVRGPHPDLLIAAQLSERIAALGPWGYRGQAQGTPYQL